MKHPIRRYCEKKSITQQEFADTVGLSGPFISQLISGRDVCGRTAALAIFQKTGGEITLAELLTWEPKKGAG